MKRIYDRSYGNEIKDKRGELTGVEGRHTNQHTNNRRWGRKKRRKKEKQERGRMRAITNGECRRWELLCLCLGEMSGDRRLGRGVRGVERELRGGRRRHWGGKPLGRGSLGFSNLLTGGRPPSAPLRAITHLLRL